MKSYASQIAAQREATRLNQIEKTSKVWYVKSEVVNFDFKYVVRSQFVRSYR